MTAIESSNLASKSRSISWIQILSKLILRNFTNAFGLVSLFVLGSMSESHAVVTEVYRQTGSGSLIDQAFENWEYNDGVNPNAPGWLRTNYNLSRIRTSATGTAVYNTSVLPQVERAVAQIARNGANGNHLPGPGVGVPGVANTGLQSPGVINALTNAANGRSNFTSTGSFPLPQESNYTGAAFTLNFSFSLSNDIVTYALTQPGPNNTILSSRTWVSPTPQAYYDQINAIEIRTSNNATSTLATTNLVLTDRIGGTPRVTNLSSVSPIANNRSVVLWTGIEGDFTLTGTYTFAAGASTGGWNHQIKGLSLIPEPSTLGFLGLSMAGLLFRRNRRG